MEAESIQKVAVLGLGTMGHGIAQAFASVGCAVGCYDDQEPPRDSLHTRIRRNLQDFVAAGMVGPNEIDPILNRITVAETERQAVADAQFVTEAVREDLAVKQELLVRLEPMVSPLTILASNSSSFPISESAAHMKHPERALVTHWFNPPHIVPTVEVVPGAKTSEQTVRTAIALLKRVGKLAVRVRGELPGFLVNRVQAALIREVWDLLDKGVASPEDIDTAIRGSIGFRLAASGPLEVADFGGLDIWTTVYNILVQDIRSDTHVPDAIRKLVDAGHLGTKTGKGIYDYGPEMIESKRTRRERRFLALAKLFKPAD